MINLYVWPFLVSRNKYLDYTTIVAPEFMCKAGAASILTNRAGGSITGENVAFYREIHESKVGKFTLVFRVIQTTFEEMGIEGSGVLREKGKKILLIEGIVIRGLEKNVIVTKENLQKVHNQIIEPYREFWKCTSSRLQKVTPSNQFELSQDSSKSCLRYQIQAPYIGDIDQPKTEVVDKLQETNAARLDNYQKTQNWRTKQTDPFNAEVTSVAFFPNGEAIAIRYESNQTVIIQNFDKEEKQVFPDEHIFVWACPTPIAISPNGEYMATAVIRTGDQNVIKLWNLRKETECLKELHGHQSFLGGRFFSNKPQEGRVLAVAFTPDNQILVSGGKDRTIFFWDTGGGGKLGESIKEFSSEIRAIAISQDKYSSILAIGDGQGKIEFWNWKKRQKIKSFSAHGSPNGLPVNSLAFSPDGKILVSGGDDYKIKIWDVNGKELNSKQHSDRVKTVAFSPNGKLIASGDEGGIITIWDIQTMEKVELREHSKEVTSLAFSPDGKTLASGSKDRTVRLWEKV